MTELIPANSTEGREWRICDVQQLVVVGQNVSGKWIKTAEDSWPPDMPVDYDNDQPQVMNDIMKHFISGAPIIDITNPEEFKK